MKAKLEFDLNDIDDKMAHLRCIKSLDLTLCLYDIMSIFRKELKYNSKLTDEETETIEKIRGDVIDLLTKYSITLDELIN